MNLSILFITRNRKAKLLRAIDSCLESNLTDKLEFVVVDNNSSDGTSDAVRNKFDSIKVAYKYYYSDENLGVAGGRNKGFSLCTGKYIFCLDDDAIIKSNGFLSKTCNIMDENPDVAAIAYHIYEPQTDRILMGNLGNNSSDSMHLCLSYFGGAHTLRKSVFVNTIYPENLYFGSEELYASHIIWEKKYKIIYMQDMLVYHLPDISNQTRAYKYKRDYNILLNQYIVRLLNYPYFLWGILSILFILRSIKNRFFGLKYIIQVGKDISHRYCREERYCISYKTILYLIKTFGLKNMF